MISHRAVGSDRSRLHHVLCQEYAPLQPNQYIGLSHFRGRFLTASRGRIHVGKSVIVYVEEALKTGMEVDKFAPAPRFLTLFARPTSSRRSRSSAPYAGLGENHEGALRSQESGIDAATLSLPNSRSDSHKTAIHGEHCPDVDAELSAVLGGCQSLHTNGYDEAFAIPTEDAMRMALRTQQIIAEETNVTQVTDPLGGSYFVESLHNRI